MSDNLPAPLVPAYLDIRELEYMPLSVQVLRDSSFTTRSTGEEFRAGLMIWCAAWHQVPAGSVMNDDAELSKLSGFGFAGSAVKEWKKVRAGAMRGFVLCSDGRLYHPVICRKAIDSWNAKTANSWRKEGDRLRKENKDREKNGKDPLEFPPKPAELVFRDDGFPSETDKHSAGNPDENALKVREGKVRDNSKKEALAPAPVIEPAKPIAPAEAAAPSAAPDNVLTEGASPNLIMDEARAIGRAFGTALETVYGSMAMRSGNATHEIHCATRWVQELGMTGPKAAAIFEAEMRDGVEKGRSQIRSLRYLDGRLRDAYAKDAAAEARREASDLPAPAPAVERPYEDHATTVWRSRLEGFRDYGAWSQSHGPKPPGLGQPRPRHADYPEALAVEVGVSSPAADEAGEAA